jgi:hypothetical protein
MSQCCAHFANQWCKSLEMTSFKCYSSFLFLSFKIKVITLRKMVSKQIITLSTFMKFIKFHTFFETFSSLNISLNFDSFLLSCAFMFLLGTSCENINKFHDHSAHKHFFPVIIEVYTWNLQTALSACLRFIRGLVFHSLSFLHSNVYIGLFSKNNNNRKFLCCFSHSHKLFLASGVCKTSPK